MDDQRALQRARRRAGAKLGFYIHLASYWVINGLLLAINLQFTPGVLWFYWPLAGWGVGVLCHGLAVFLGRSIMQRLTEYELEKEHFKG